MASNLNLSNTSYTNKEFNDIYPELLEKAKDLSYKWDPTVSNESDPGVTLIKEIALALDKINYSADKNALETMPLSVTQERTARQLFQLLGYYPKWFISSEAQVSMAWKTDPDAEDYVENGVVKVPAFTQIRDDSGDYVYTIPIDTLLHSDGSIEQVTAIQGPVKTLKINNSTLITLDLLDQNNRVYFPDYNIAQNGVFVIGKDAQESKQINARSFWEQKDNLYVEEVGNYYYSFNVDVSTNRCYLEFPTDISDLIGGGIYVYYLISSGKDGIVGIGQLNQLYDSSINAEYVQGGTGTVVLNNDNLRIQNVDLTVTGKDPESIDSMYQNYNHIKGTFDTLITLRDYNNAVYNTGEVSNAVVCDRTNDIQQSYRIVASTLNGSENVVYTQEADRSSDPYKNGKLDPFGLKVYALQYNDLTNTTSTSQNKQAYDNTFQMFTDLDVEDPLNIDSSLRQLVVLLNDERCVQHDFSNIEPNKMCLIKNVAEINLTVFPTVKLTELQKQDVTNSIRNQIYNLYNARRVNFGEEINYDDLFTNILTSSNLIKNISLSQIKYYTYALYYSDGEYDGTSKLAPAWKQVCVSDEVDYVLATIKDTYTLSDGSNRVVHNAYIGATNDDVLTMGKKNIYLMATNSALLNDNVYYLNRDGNVVLYSTKRNEFREEILVKNILAGVTPLCSISESGFIYGANESDTQFESAQVLDIQSTMPFSFNNTAQAKYYPKQNEVIQFVKPQLNSQVSYGSYVKYDYVGRNVNANADHKLSADECLVLYYKTQDDDSAPYTRVVYGSYSNEVFKPAIICPTFNLQSTTRQIQFLYDQTQVPSTALTIKSGQSIDIKQKNEVVLNNITNYIYVIGSEYVNDEGIQYYRLKLLREKEEPDDEGYYYYTTTLQNEQQLIYASDQLSYLNIVGSGTRVTIRTTVGEKEITYIENPVVSVRSIQRYGVSALDGKWKKISDKITLLAQEFVNVIGTADDSYDENTDAYVEIISPVSIGATINLTRDGLSYSSTDADMSQGVSVGSVSYVDTSGNNRIQNITPQPDVVSQFVTNSNYYDEDPNESFVDSITLTPQSYITEQIDGIYQDGNGPLSIYGIKSSEWSFTSGGTAHYLISGSSIYLVVKNGETQQIAQIKGYPSDLENGNIVALSTQQTSAPYIYQPTDSSVKLGPHQSLIVVNSNAPIESQFYSSDYVETNPDGEDRDIYFQSDIDLSSYTAYKVDSFYRIDSVIFDYNTSASNASQYVIPTGDGTPVASNSSNVSDGNPKNYITIQAHDVATNRRITFALTKAVKTYKYNNASGSAVKALRYWAFTNSHGDTAYIEDGDVKSKVFNYFSATYTDRTLNSWVWPISDFSINLVAAKDVNELDPSIYQFKYKNKGGDEETLQLASEVDSGWSIYGLSYIDSSNTEPTKIYENQILKINGETITVPEDNSSYVYSSIPLYIEGYDEQTLKYIDSNGEEDYPRMLVTTIPKNPENYEETFKTKTINIKKEVGTYSSTDGWSGRLKLIYNPPMLGYYIFKIKNYFDLKRFNFAVTYTQCEVTCFNAQPTSKSINTEGRNDDVYDLKNKGTYYFCINPSYSTSEGDLEIAFYFGIEAKTTSYATTGLTNDEYELLTNKGSVNVEVSSIQPLGFADGAYITTNNFLDIVPKVTERATYNGKDVFNYFYQPNPDKLIENPLESTSFNNHNHFYNPYTICKVQTYDILGDSNIYINT